MSISKLVDNRSYGGNSLGSFSCPAPDCMYNVNGGCAAEWCIYSELPKFVAASRIVTCSICGETTTTVSLNSGTTSWVCPKCQEKIKKVTPDERPCSICGKMVPVDQYICTDCQKKISKTITNLTCPICGASIKPGQTMCSSCASKVRSKLNE